MPAMKVYRWSYIAPGATVNLYLHGFPNNWASTFSAVVYALSGQAYYPLGSINLTQGEVDRHIENTIARKAWVQNLALFNPCAVDLSILYDSF
jgi:hypothetical protein